MGKDKAGSSRNTGQGQGRQQKEHLARTGKAAAAAAGTLGKDREGSSRNIEQGQGRQQQEH